MDPFRVILFFAIVLAIVVLYNIFSFIYKRYKLCTQKNKIPDPICYISGVPNTFGVLSEKIQKLLDGDFEF